MSELPPSIMSQITKQFGPDDDYCDGTNPGRDAAIKIAKLAYTYGREGLWR